MKKLIAAFGLLVGTTLQAQTLFTYGNQAVASEEFLQAFRKNNNAPVTEKALREYLDLYIASRLKVADAKAMGLDTLPQMKSDLANLRQQILPNYLNDKQGMDRLVNEAVARSQKDIKASHIFISFARNGTLDTAAAKQRLNDALAQLNKGLPFADAAKKYSDDPSAATTGGGIGWVTVFTLPYSLENLLYATPVGKHSSVLTAKAGYHIMRNDAERKAVGRIQAAQILFAFPPGADEKTKAGVKRIADSAYKRLVAGDDFGKMAAALSNDAISAANGGKLETFGVGDYDPVFETTVLSLPKNNAVSKPFLTSHGWHIAKRLAVVPVSPNPSEDAKAALRAKIEGGDRAAVLKAATAEKVVGQTGYSRTGVADAALWAYTDSVLAVRQGVTASALHPSTALFTMGDYTGIAQQWIAYAQTHRNKPDGSGFKTYPQLWNGFVQEAALNYYAEHLEYFNPEFGRQLTEFAEGNLFFEVMQQKVWTPAQQDTTALLQHFNKNRSAYNWKPSANAVMFYATNGTAAQEFYKALKASPASWKNLVSARSEEISADSGRFEMNQIVKPASYVLKPGAVIPPVVNKADGTATLSYVIKLYTTADPRTFEQAKGLVITDYQAALEQAWLAELKGRYPVKLDGAVWKATVVKAK